MLRRRPARAGAALRRPQVPALRAAVLPRRRGARAPWRGRSPTSSTRAAASASPARRPLFDERRAGARRLHRRLLARPAGRHPRGSRGLATRPRVRRHRAGRRADRAPRARGPRGAEVIDAELAAATVRQAALETESDVRVRSPRRALPGPGGAARGRAISSGWSRSSSPSATTPSRSTPRRGWR